MTQPVRSDELRLDDMLDALRDIREHLRLGWEVFSRDRDLQKVIAYDLTIFGEAGKRVSVRTKKTNPTIPWTEVIEYGNNLIHEYHTLDLKDTWEFYRSELRNLERKLRRVRVVALERDSQEEG